MNIDKFPSISRVVFNVTVRNASPYIQKCLQSIVDQTNDYWLCFVTDDASEDGTAKIIKDFTTNKNKFIPIFNIKRKWKMENFKNAINSCCQHDIIVELDGDDILCNPNFVEEIANLHTTYNVIWTQHRINISDYPDWHIWKSTALPENWTRIEPYRETVFSPKMYPGHVRTFKKYYFDRIKPEDLLYKGFPLEVTSDVAYYTPIVEMAHPTLRYFYDRECAIYNIVSNNDTLVDRKLKNQHFSKKNIGQIQSEVGQYIKKISPYSPPPLAHKIIFITPLNFNEWYKVAICFSITDPFCRIHLFCYNKSLANRLLHMPRHANMYVYDLDYLINNSLSPIKRFFDINFINSYIQDFYYFCIRHVANHFHHDSIKLYPVDKLNEIVQHLYSTQLQKIEQIYCITTSMKTKKDFENINSILENRLSKYGK